LALKLLKVNPALLRIRILLSSSDSLVVCHRLCLNSGAQARKMFALQLSSGSCFVLSALSDLYSF
jgi:hypothetical protein